MKSKKEYHKSRKFMILVFLIFFAYSVTTFRLRGMQRIRNLKTIEKTYNNLVAFDLVNSKSKIEDSFLVVVANLLVVSVFIIADKRRVFE